MSSPTFDTAASAKVPESNRERQGFLETAPSRRGWRRQGDRNARRAVARIKLENESRNKEGPEPIGRQSSDRVYSPVGADGQPILVFYHGGGFRLGGLDSYDPICRDLAARSGAIVVSVAYRLAPEHVYPAAFGTLHVNSFSSP